jgi:hypothetical protein
MSWLPGVNCANSREQFRGLLGKSATRRCAPPRAGAVSDATTVRWSSRDRSDGKLSWVLPPRVDLQRGAEQVSRRANPRDQAPAALETDDRAYRAGQ